MGPGMLEHYVGGAAVSVIDRNEAIHSLLMKLRQVGRIQIGRILGSVPSTSGSYMALIDLFERCYFMRAELNALANILIKKGVFTQPEWSKECEKQFREYLAILAEAWPEIEFTDSGYTIKDIKALQERAAREGWPA